MQKEVADWILGIVASLLVAGIVAGVRGHINIITRLTKIETMFSMLGTKVANILHSPHTPELDSMLEKYTDSNYNLSSEEWTKLKNMCSTIEIDKSVPKEERALAGFMVSICDYNLGVVKSSFTNHSKQFQNDNE